MVPTTHIVPTDCMVIYTVNLSFSSRYNTCSTHYVCQRGLNGDELLVANDSFWPESR